MKIALVTNSLAGNGKAILLSNRLRRILSSRDIKSEIFIETEWSPHVYEFDQVWIVGGDGTVNYFVNQFHDIKKPLAIFNGGTGNDFYALLYGKMSVKAQVDRVLKASPRPIDAGKCNDRYFLNGIGLGFEGAVAKSLTGAKKFRGKISFMIHILKHIFTYQEHSYSIKTEGLETEQTCLMISIANGTRYAGGFYVAPLANPQDGLFDVIIVNKLTSFQRLRRLLSLIHI